MQTAVLPQMLQKQLANGQTVRLLVESNSMSPSIRRGDTIMLEACRPTDLRIGDIVTVWHGNGLLTHRIVEIDSTVRQLILRGDRLEMTDAPVRFEHVVGRVTAVIRGKNGRFTKIRTKLCQLLASLIKKARA